MHNTGRILTSEEIFESVWKEKYYSSNSTVMVHIWRLREKIGENPKKPKIIETVGGWDMNMEQNRFKSWAVWLSFAGLVFLILAKVVGLDIDAEVWNEVLAALGTVLVGFGILNNPTNGDGF